MEKAFKPGFNSYDKQSGRLLPNPEPSQNPTLPETPWTDRDSDSFNEIQMQIQKNF